ncbi:MAG: hypothetical protein PVJ57_19750 [Phycisphaerae bacterium]
MHYWIGDGATGTLYTLYAEVNFGSLVQVQIPDVDGIFHPGEWHHLAIVWDKVGIGGSGECVRVYIDGVVCGANTSNAWGDTPDVGNRHTIGKGEGFDDGTPAFVIDNIKVWDYGKWDFSDRFTEAPVPFQLELLAELPPTGGVTVDFVDALQVRDAQPNEIVLVTQNVGAHCGGGTPASAWKVTLDPETGKAISAVLKQSLSLIQCVRASVFEASDGTLFTGGGWCLAKLPYVSFDGGETWRPATHSTHPPNSTFSFVEFQGSVYAGTGYDPHPAEIYRWLGGGGPNDWEHIHSFPRPRTVVDCLTVYQGRLFVGLGLIPCWGCEGTTAVYVSDDGVSYTPTVGIPSCDGANWLLAVGDSLLAFTEECQPPSNRYVYRWDDAIAEWTTVASYPLSRYAPKPVVHGGYIYAYGQQAGDPSRGIYRSNDLGVTWERVVELEDPVASAFHVHDDTLYIGTFRDASDNGWVYRMALAAAPPPSKLALEPDQTCYQIGDEVTIEVWMRDVPEDIVGGQFLLQYDAEFVLGSTAHAGAAAITPGDEPFTRQVHECSTQEQTNPQCTPEEGLIEYSVGVSDFNDSATGSHRLAVLHFTATAEICNAEALLSFRPLPPFETRLTTSSGTAYYVDQLVDLPTVTLDSTPPVLTPPPGITVNADAGGCSAMIDPGTATGVDNCGGPVEIECSRNDGLALTDPYPAGTTMILWVAIDECDNVAFAEQSVTVLPYNDVNITIELQGPVQNTVVRCFTFRFYGCVQHGPMAELETNVTFPANAAGNSVASILLTDLPCSPTGYDCVSGEDDLHTLRVQAEPTIAGTQYAVELTAPASVLFQADLYNDNIVDILDFGVFVAEWDWSGDPDTPCGVSFPHADMDASGYVDLEDYAFIDANYFMVGDAACCELPPAAEPRCSITVAELRALGLPHLAVADLTNDGVVDALDVQAFADGERPESPMPGLGPEGVLRRRADAEK